MLKRVYWILTAQFGLNPRLMLRSFISFPRYLRGFFHFRANYKGRLELVPCLHDWYEEGGATKDEYFWQDLFVARLIFAANPNKHVDIGSRVDGFVAHVASFRDIEVLDIRSISASVPGVIFKQSDLMNPTPDMVEYCDSLSCLHALEHFGLGRYGDSIDPNGYVRGMRNMAKILRSGGVFYLSLPVGIERVEFNANRVFDPRTIVEVAANNQLVIQKFYSFTALGGLIDVGTSDSALVSIACCRYSLGIFTFLKV